MLSDEVYLDTPLALSLILRFRTRRQPQKDNADSLVGRRYRPLKSRITKPARAGPAIRERLKVALCSAVAFTMWAFPTISGVAEALAGMLKARTVPLKSPK